MQAEKIAMGKKSGIRNWLAHRTTIDKMMLRRHSPSYVSHSIIYAVNRSGGIKKHAIQQKNSG